MRVCVCARDCTGSGAGSRRTGSSRRLPIVAHTVGDGGAVPDSECVAVVAGVRVLGFDTSDKTSAAIKACSDRAIYDADSG